MDKVNKYNFDALPFIKGHGRFTTYRIMIDNETEDTFFGKEYIKLDGNSYSLSLGDFIVKLK